MSHLITISQSTLDSYLKANYFVVDRPIGAEKSEQAQAHQIRIGQSTPQLEHIFRKHGATSGFIVTAWNPHSVEQTREENDRANDRMLRHELLRDSAIHCYASYGSDDAATWREEGFFLIGVNTDQAKFLCKTFSQNAGVMVHADKPAELIWHPEVVLS